ASQAPFNLARPPCGQVCEPSLRYPLHVLGVNRLLPSPASSRLKRKAGGLVPSLVPEFTRAIRQSAPGDCRHGIDDRAEFVFGFLQLIQRPRKRNLRSLPLECLVIAIDTDSIPARDLSLLIVDGHRADQETAILFVKP